MTAQERALLFQRLALHRMPGFPEGAFTVEELEPGVNLVFGPNASGKSTTARALQAILWPTAAPARARLTAQFRLDGDDWNVDLDHDRVIRQRNGAETDPPPVPPEEVRSRYVLSLQELLAEEDRDLAHRIVLESQGGFDVEAAARDLDFRENHRAPRAAVESFRAAESRWEEVTRREEELRSQEAHLRDLEEERHRAQVAQTQLRWVEQLEVRARARRDLEKARKTLSAYPDAMERVRPDDGHDLKNTREVLKAAADDEAKAKADAQRAREERDATGLPAEGIPPGLRSELSEDLRKCQDLERRVEELRRSVEGARARRGEAAKPLNLDAGETPTHLGADEVSEVDRFIRRREELLRKKEGRQERLAALPHYSSDDAARQQLLDEGVNLLREWVRLGGVAPTGRRRVYRWARTASAFSLASAGGFAALPFVAEVDPLWALGALGPVLALVAVETSRVASAALGAAEDTRRAGIRKRVAQLGLEPPKTWDMSGVSERLHQLEGEREEIRRREATSWERKTLSQEVFDLETQLARLDGERAELVERLSMPPAREDLGIRWLSEVMSAWWRAHEEVAEREGELASAQVTARAALDDLSKKLRHRVGPVDGAPWEGEGALADAEAAAAAVDDLDRRVEAHGQALGAMKEAQRSLEDARERARDAQERARGILERLGLEEDDDATAHRWVGWLDEYRQAESALRDAEVSYRQAHSRLRDLGSPPDLDELPIPDKVLEEYGSLWGESGALEGEALAEGSSPAHAANGSAGQDGSGGASLQTGAAAGPVFGEEGEALPEASPMETPAAQASAAQASSVEAPAVEAVLEAASPEALADLRPSLEEQAAGLDDLQERIGDIRGRLERAREKHDREEALAERLEAAEALRRRRDGEAASVVGARLAGWLHRETRDHARPPVFRRAQANFETVTQSRYRLELDGAGEGAEVFRAVDQTTGLGHALNELSDGTRVQLLLAVRLAFVESQEQGVALPLVLDEVLANADDHRAPAVMRAVAAMAEAGRQVFYFTAQQEELARWRSVLGEVDGLSWKVLDLTEARARGAPERLEPPAPVPAPTPPSPKGLDLEAYGRRLGVPPVHAREPVDAVHLWYLVERPEALHGLLALGLDRWGSLRRYAEAVGSEGLPARTEPLPRLRARAAAVSAYLEGWLEGRGRPVERADLHESGAVSDRFLDEVDALRQEVGRDAALLLQALEEGRVKGFRSRNREILEDYFQAGGHLDDAEPNSPEELRRRALVAARSVDPEVPPKEVDRLLARIAGAGPTNADGPPDAFPDTES